LALSKEAFTNGGFFVDEFDRIFTSSLASNEYYQKIIAFLAVRKSATRNDILKFLKLGSGGTITGLLQDLEECGFIEIVRPLGVKPTSTLCRYEIRDAYLQFYFKFINPLKNKIQNDHFQEQPVLALNMDTYRKWLGFAFERWCRRNSHVIAKKIGFSAVQYDSGVYFNRQNFGSLEEGAQIDLLYKRSDRVITLCEIKYTSAPVGLSVVRDVERKLNLLKVGKTSSINKVLISANGAEKSVINKAYFDRIFTLEVNLPIYQ
jgi:hypothetical protein